MIGKTIGRYRIVAMLGKGGMGTVWKAEDTLLGRSVALKLLNETEADSEEARLRFIREAQSASKLAHAGIATVYDAGESDGRIYLAFLFVDGETLAQKISRGPLPPAEAIRLCRNAATALAHAHDQGVLHRDIKSSNLMVTADGRLIVVDFGLAHPEDQTRITRTGTVMGTVAFMAPEIVEGGEADARSDIYSLGAVLYEMLTGRTPFKAERSEAMMYLVVHEDPDPPSRWMTGIGADLDRVVLKAVERSPERRYASMAEMDRDLALLDDVETRRTPFPGGGVGQHLPGWVPEPIRSGRLRPQFLLFALLLTFLAVGTLVFRTLGIGPFKAATETITSVAVLPLRNASPDPEDTDYIAEGIGNALATRLNELPDLRVVPWVTSQRYPDLDRIQETARKLNVDAVVVGTFRMSGNQIQTSLSLVDGRKGFQRWADDFVEPMGDLFSVEKNIALAVAKNLRGTLTPTESEALAEPPAHSQEAYNFYLDGAYELQGGSEAAAARALQLFERATAIDSTLAEAWVGVGAVHNTRYFFGWEGGGSNLDIAEQSFATALGLKPSLWEARGGLIRIAYERGQSEKALMIGHEVRSDRPDDVGVLMVQAESYIFGALPDKSIPLLKRVIEIDPVNEGAYWFQVIACAWSLQYEQTLVSGQEYFDLFGAEPEVHFWVAVAHQALGHKDLAAENYDKALAIFGHDTNVYAHFVAGEFFRDIGQPEKAQRIWEQGRRIAAKSVEAWPDNLRMRCLEGALQGVLGDTLGMKAATEYAIRSPGPHAAFIALAWMAIGKPAEAAGVLENLVQNGCLFRYVFTLFVSKEDLARPEIAAVLADLSTRERRLREMY